MEQMVRRSMIGIAIIAMTAAGCGLFDPPSLSEATADATRRGFTVLSTVIAPGDVPEVSVTFGSSASPKACSGTLVYKGSRDVTMRVFPSPNATQSIPFDDNPTHERLEADPRFSECFAG